MRGHQHLGDPSLTQNQGNTLGDRPCVRQSRLYREHVGGNAMKELMGQDGLKWDTTQTQGVYAGGKAFDHNNAQKNCGANGSGEKEQQEPQPQQQQQQQEQRQDEEVVIAIDAAEESPLRVQQPSAAQEQQNQQTAPQAQQQQAPGAQPVASRAFRPGAGYANRQSYNIFTGE
ncbi:hypothetical protein DQ04_06821010 [Trypanosoma grayi]|uniref:hypothetical protein n=1 Tax=Trypanosoma grayi TaxID=71804 RepID=UPI0004F3FA88|nr:hypothetical protein DQ04_06821010 [Trypanosoma grayi]KEG08605.1 hypothetical protein DQ04_06821010 [Trypanosoma grayi]